MENQVQNSNGNALFPPSFPRFLSKSWGLVASRRLELSPVWSMQQEASRGNVTEKHLRPTSLDPPTTNSILPLCLYAFLSPPTTPETWGFLFATVRDEGRSLRVAHMLSIMMAVLLRGNLEACWGHWSDVPASPWRGKAYRPWGQRMEFAKQSCRCRWGSSFQRRLELRSCVPLVVTASCGCG